MRASAIAAAVALMPLAVTSALACSRISGFDALEYDPNGSEPPNDAATAFEIAIDDSTSAFEIAIDVSEPDAIAVTDTVEDSESPGPCDGDFLPPVRVALRAADGTIDFALPYVTPDGRNLILTSDRTPRRLHRATRASRSADWSAPVVVHSYSTYNPEFASIDGEQIIASNGDITIITAADGGTHTVKASGDINRTYAEERPVALDEDGLTLFYYEGNTTYTYLCDARRSGMAPTAAFARRGCEDRPSGVTAIAMRPNALEFFLGRSGTVERVVRPSRSTRLGDPANARETVAALAGAAPRSMTADGCELYATREGETGVFVYRRKR